MRTFMWRTLAAPTHLPRLAAAAVASASAMALVASSVPGPLVVAEADPEKKLLSAEVRAVLEAHRAKEQVVDSIDRVASMRPHETSPLPPPPAPTPLVADLEGKAQPVRQASADSLPDLTLILGPERRKYRAHFVDVSSLHLLDASIPVYALVAAGQTPQPLAQPADEGPKIMPGGKYLLVSIFRIHSPSILAG